MIFALSTDDRALIVFPNESAATSYCEGIDVEDGNWVFFDATGNSLDAEFTTPNKRGAFSVVSGTYILRPSISPKTLLGQLNEVASVEGIPPYDSITEIRALLESSQVQ